MLNQHGPLDMDKPVPGFHIFVDIQSYLLKLCWLTLKAFT